MTQRLRGGDAVGAVRRRPRRLTTRSMDFAWTSEEASFRQRLRDFLAATLPEGWERFSEHGPASPALTAYAREFCGKLAAEGLLTPHWPKEIGGQGRDPWHQTIIAAERGIARESRGGA